MDETGRSGQCIYEALDAAHGAGGSVHELRIQAADERGSLGRILRQGADDVAHGFQSGSEGVGVHALGVHERVGRGQHGGAQLLAVVALGLERRLVGGKQCFGDERTHGRDDGLGRVRSGIHDAVRLGQVFHDAFAVAGTADPGQLAQHALYQVLEVGGHGTLGIVLQQVFHDGLDGILDQHHRLLAGPEGRDALVGGLVGQQRAHEQSAEVVERAAEADAVSLQRLHAAADLGIVVAEPAAQVALHLLVLRVDLPVQVARQVGHLGEHGGQAVHVGPVAVGMGVVVLDPELALGKVVLAADHDAVLDQHGRQRLLHGLAALAHDLRQVGVQ